jgi:hypothetical protein
VLVPPVITGISVTATNVSVICTRSWAGYLLQYKDSIASSQWLPLPPPVAGTGGGITISDNRAPIGQRFYRVQCNGCAQTADL